MLTYGYWNYNYGTIGTLLFILIWIIIIGLIIEILRAIIGPSYRSRPNPPTPPAPPQPPAHPVQRSSLDILNERYAKGEIDKVEYDQKRADIINSHHN